MKKRDLIQAVATHTDVDKKTATLLVEGTIDVILATVAKGEVVNISGFAKFAKINRPARMARNPATGEAVKVKAKTVAKISALKGFKDIALGVAPAPKLVTVRKPAAPAAKTGFSGFPAGCCPAGSWHCPAAFAAYCGQNRASGSWRQTGRKRCPDLLPWG